MADFTTRDKVALLKDFLNVVGVETEGVEVKITQDADNGMRFYADPEVVVEVKNATGAQLDAGTPVYVSGTALSGKPEVSKARADSTTTMPAIGLVQADIADGDEGFVVCGGLVRNLDTDTPAWDDGTALYVSPTTAGTLTATRPTGATQLVQKVALVTRRHATVGSVIVMGAGRSNDLPNDVTYRDRYQSQAETRRSGATATTEIYYTARPDGDGYAENEVSDVGETDTILRRLYFSDKFEADPDTGADWTAYTTQPADNETFANSKTALLAGLSDTDGTANTRGTLPVSLKMERTVVSQLLLDAYTGAAAAYSVRKLRTAYSGSALRVREDSGNTEADIGFDGNGDLDTDAIASHCGSANGYVVTWYDQAGANDATQSTTANQPLIYNGTATLTENGKPAVEFDGSSDKLEATYTDAVDYHGIFIVVSYDSTGDINSTFSIGKSSRTKGDVFIRDNGYFVRFFTGNSDVDFVAITETTSQQLIAALWDGVVPAGPTTLPPDGTLAVYQDGVLTDDSAADDNFGATGSGIALGFDPSNNYLNGKMQECIFWDSDQSSNRTGIEGNVNTYFSIY